MGMYTEIIFGASLVKRLPEEIVLTIKKLTEGEDLGEDAPDHPFFESERSWLLRSGGSYYFPGTVEPKFWFDAAVNQWFLHFRTNIKNYDSVIEKFLDWIKPYIDSGSGCRDFYAIVIYEEESKPKIYYLDE